MSKDPIAFLLRTWDVSSGLLGKFYLGPLCSAHFPFLSLQGALLFQNFVIQDFSIEIKNLCYVLWQKEKIDITPVGVVVMKISMLLCCLCAQDKW